MFVVRFGAVSTSTVPSRNDSLWRKGITLNTAHLVTDRLSWFNGYASLYRLEPPLRYTDYFSGLDGEDEERDAEYVIVSAADVMFSGPETYIFPATADGEIAAWGELTGSFKGGLDPARALEGAGYEVRS